MLTKSTMPSVFFGGDSAEAPVGARRALGIADVYAATRAIVDAASTLPLHLYRRAEGGRERADGPAAELLRRPAPTVPQYALLGQLYTCLTLHGQGFLGKYRDERGQVAQLGVLDPTAVKIEVRGGLVFFTVTLSDGRRQTLTESDILHVRGPLSLDGVNGCSPLTFCAESLDAAQSMTRHAAATFRNDARPSGVLTVASGPDQDDTMRALEQAWQRRHGGPQNAGRVAVIAGDIEFKAIGLSAHDAQFVEQRQLSTVEVCRIFRVPPWMLGAKSGDAMTYSTVEGQGLAFVTYCLRPWLVAVEQSLSADRDLCPEGHYVETSIDALLRADHRTRSEVYTAALHAETGWMSRAEVRELENLPAEIPQEAGRARA